MRILMPIDGSLFSKAALAFVASRSSLIKSQPQLELLNVQTPVSSRVLRAAGRELVLKHQALEANKIIKPALAQLKRAGLPALAKTVVGNPGTEAGRVAVADAADLIVMGSHGHTGFMSLLFGSVTQAVLASCNTAMLVVRSDGAPKHDSLKLAIALDGSKYGLAAVRYVVKHRALFGEAPMMTLVHVVPDLLTLAVPGFFGEAPVFGFSPAQMAEMQRAAFERVMAPARKLLQAAGLPAAEAQLVGNNPGDVVAAYATKYKLDLLVLGSKGAGGLRSSLLGSVATRIATQCRNTLLLVQQK